MIRDRAQPVWLTTGDVARACGVSMWTVKVWCDRGEIPTSRIGSGLHRRVAPADFAAFARRTFQGQRLDEILAAVGEPAEGGIGGR